ncbi:nucleoside hydrolase [Nocardia nova]|uniref:nucleoside hydrolase n=1 Tax=Nocardia nova TaxID=37330 RepID=UPI0009EE9F46|nr:nucleoside hydrolase [Nocardia nova]
MTCNPPRPRLQPLRASLDTPSVVFTDIGGDVDDAAALVLMAITDPQLALVVTVDEYPDGRRAKLARHLLDLLGRSDVRVVAGLSLGASGYWAADGLFPADIDLPHVDLHDVMSELCEAGAKSVRCLSLGPLTDLARLLIADTHRTAPLGLQRLLRVTAMGGALQYRKPERAEHNWRMNPAAVQTVLAEVEHVALVLSDHTFVDEIAVSVSSPIYRLLNSWPERWAQLLRAHYDQFFARFYPASKLHDAVAASLILGESFVQGEQFEFCVARDARMQPGAGTQAWLSTSVDCPAFMAWVSETLRSALARQADAQVIRQHPSDHVGSLS